MKKSIQFLKTFAMGVLVLILTSSYGQKPGKVDKNKVIQEIYRVEKRFQDDLNALGVAYAFSHYASDNATIKRGNDSLIYSKAGIARFYSSETYKSAKAFWKPDFVDVSDDGSMAYTYGKYTWNIMGKDKVVKSYSGIFHTVWKKSANGEWLYVWD